MKRSLLAAALCFFWLVLLGEAFAQESPAVADWSRAVFNNQMAAAKNNDLTGTVVSHDPVCHCIVVKTPEGELTLQDDYARFMQEYNEAKGLRIGAKVKGTYKTVNHIHYITDIHYAD